MGVALALSGRNIKEKHNNNRVSALSVEENLERWRAGGGACGETLSRRLGRQMEQHKNYKNTIHGGIYWPPIGKPKHNNQPKTGGRDGGEHGGDIRRAGHVGEARCHHFGGVVSWIGGKNIKKIDEFSN
jgi:hypothetical protein